MFARCAYFKPIVDDYILTASPVGSRTLSKRDDIELSPATIRNEMSDLTELGFLEQPHTSAGRIPSEKAYRLYVNSIMDRAKLTDEESEYIRRHLNTRVNEVGEVIRETARMLSGITKYTSVVQTPQIKNARFKRISFDSRNGRKGISRYCHQQRDDFKQNAFGSGGSDSAQH